MASNIAVKVTADIVDLRAKMALAQAEVRNTTTEMNKLSRAAASSGVGDQLSPQLLQAAQASVQAQGKLAGVRKELEGLGGGGGGGHGAISTATREFRALFDELSSGRTRQTPGTLAIIATRVLGMGPAALIATAGIGGLVIGLGYLAVKAIEAAQAVDKINLSMLGTQGFAASQEQIRKQIDLVKELENVSSADAEKIVSTFATMANRSQGTFTGLSLATKGWAELTGQETDKAAEQLAKVFGAPLSAQTKEFITNLRGVTSAELDAFEKAQRAGDVYGAQKIVLEALNNTIGVSNQRLAEHAANIHTSWKNLGEYILLVNGGLSGEEAQAAMLDQEAAKWKKLQDAIRGATNALAQQQQTPQQKLSTALLDAAAVDTTRTRIAELKSKVTEFQDALKNPLATDDMKANFKSAIKAAQTELTSLNNKKAFAGTGFENAGAKEIAQARETISAINADQTKGDTERRAQIDQTYADLLKSNKLNAAQRIEVETEKNKAIAAADRQGANEKRQIDQATAQNEQRIAQVGFDEKRSAIEQEVTAGNITRQEGLQKLLDLTDQETAARLGAVAKAEQGYAADSVFFRQKELEKNLIVAESEAQKAAIRRQIEEASATETRQIWQRSMQQIEGVENTFVTQLLSGRVGLYGALRAAGAQFLQAELQQTIRGMSERLLLSKSELAANQSLGQLGVLFHWLFEGQKTAATTAGETARLGVKESAKAAGAAADVASGSAQIMNDASKAAAGAYSAVAGTPIVGPILAPIAAGTAFAAVAAFDTLTSLDVGTNYVPRDMPVMIHKGERVIPAADNSAILAALQGGAANQNGGVTLNYHPPADRQTDHRSDAKDMIRMLNHARRTGALKVK